MEDAQFLVQWDEHPTHLATRLGYLLEHQSLVDVTLMCNTHTLKVHRAVLAASSPYFERQLGNHPLIVLKDMKFSVLKSLVEFMYCGETSVSEENLTPLLEAAKFFEVKGLAAMTKETVCVPGAASHSNKSLNGTSTPNSSVFNRGTNRGRGRGRGRPPLNPTCKMGSPTESAQILLSLSGNSNSPPCTQFFTTSKNVKIDPSIIQNNLASGEGGGFEPRRRGRRRGALNSAFREKLLRDDDGQQLNSPLLSSLLSKPDVKTNNKLDDSKYLQTLKNIGLPTNVPILLDNGEGKLVTLTEEVLRSVMDSDGNVQFQVTEGTLGGGCNSAPLGDTPMPMPTFEKKHSDMDETNSVHNMVYNRHNRQFVEKDMESSRSDEDNLSSLRNGAASEAEQDPEAVVLLEVTGDKRVEKYVMSAKEVKVLKALNQQLTKQKKQLADITSTNSNLSTIDLVGTNTKVAELKLKIGKTKSILSQVMECVQKGLREKLKTYTEQLDKKPHSQVVQLEFIDCNGEKIEGYQVEGTVVDKRPDVKECPTSPKENDLMGLFGMVCQDKGKAMSKEEEDDENYRLVMNNHVLEDEEDHQENIPYDQIEAMMGDQEDIVIEHNKEEDLKYIIDNGEDDTGSAGHGGDTTDYVVYDEKHGAEGAGEYIIYGGHPESVLPDMVEEEEASVEGAGVTSTADNFVVADTAEYIVYEKNDESLVVDKGSTPTGEEEEEEPPTQYIVYTSDENTDKSQERYELYKTDHEEEEEEEDMEEGEVEVQKLEDQFIVYPDKVTLSASQCEASPAKDVPFAVGLVPLKDALEKLQSISDHQPRRTRSNSLCSETANKRRLSVGADAVTPPCDKRHKSDPPITPPPQLDTETL
ncbi:hypothetical protein AAG570_004070 [Ranatra chinensis]|uniref:BTB domain-containing protein n=1 Tax=Ranatra chinensis TaxID=642074 RepID=A0ABD0YRA7_9HEMI